MLNKKERRELNNIEKKKLLEFFSQLLECTEYPDHKKENTKIMFQRMMGRAMPSTWEYHTFMGVLSGAINHLSQKKQKKKR
jgi:tRNA C32,U32 (ribose-2'-O)-methylase TrmJ